MLDRWVDRVNYNIDNYKAASAITFFGSGILPFWGLYGALSLTNLHFSPDLALCYVIVRSLKRFRLPVDAALAALVANTFPILTRINISKLNPVEIPPEQQTKLTKAIMKVNEVADKYG
jgi:hypothetical protein